MNRIATYRLTISTIVGLIFSLLFAVGSLITLGYYSYKKESNIKISAAKREMTTLIEKLSPDERYVVDNNLPMIVTEQRRISPLLLRRQYYSGLPKTKKW